jgi:dihydroxyacetone kinase
VYAFLSFWLTFVNLILAVFAISPDSLTRVSLLAGGGAGHEPAHAAFVGKGMLSGAVSGFVFASPSVAQVVNSIRYVGGQAGTVLIIKNYTGDVFHFHLAAEKALANSGIQVEVVVVGDDVSVGRKKSGKVGRRGLAGTVLVHKILGSMVSTPDSTLKQIAETGRLVASSLVTVGASLGHVHVPGRGAMLEAVAEDSVELGMGIHNETGCQILNPRPDLPTLVEMMLDQLLDQKDSDRAYVDMSKAEEIVLLINNLGSVSELEFGGITTQVLIALSKLGASIKVNY